MSLQARWVHVAHSEFIGVQVWDRPPAEYSPLGHATHELTRSVVASSTIGVTTTSPLEVLVVTCRTGCEMQGAQRCALTFYLLEAGVTPGALGHVTANGVSLVNAGRGHGGQQSAGEERALHCWKGG